MVKIDVDGYDGQVLKGATEILQQHRPVVIFEWHPILCNQAHTNYKEHFRALLDAGYNRFIWFTKFGNFSHFTVEPADAYIDQWAEICEKATFDNDWHYDVVALHKDSDLSILSFADSNFSRNKKSQY